ncbi:MAG: MBL fold metallo-hydrolase [Spirochaetota bacterium]|nr:MBL fold metallo-hydrolase [Spirochaetota bacterium]
MKIANYDIYTIEAGRFRLDGGAMFGIIPKPLWNKKIDSDDNNKINLTLRCLLLKSDNKNILIDTGIGNKFDNKEKSIFQVCHSKSSLESSLNELGLSKYDITHVILSHLHFDHAGGATERDDMGNLNPSFPNAVYYIQRKNLEWALNPSDKDRKSYLKEDIQPIIEQNKLKILSGDVDLFPNIKLLVINGHTVGQQMVKISDKNTTLLYCADLIPTTSHLSPHWIMAYDLYPLKSIEEKKNILLKAYNKNWILFFDHDPNIEACTIKHNEDNFSVNEVFSFKIK